MTSLRLCLAALILCAMPAIAQTTEVRAKPLTDADIKLFRQDLQSVKDDIIKDTMQLTDAEAAKFWPVYREYSREQYALADTRLRLITDYAQNLDKMDDPAADALTQRFLKLEDDNQALRRSYLPKFIAALGAKRTAKFYQVDNRLTMMTNVQLASEIPLIP